MNWVQALWDNIDKILLLVGFVVSIVGGAYVLRFEVKTLGTRMGSIEKQLEALGNVLIMIARQDERQNAADRRNDERFQNLRREIDLLRRGEGMVLPIHRGAYEHGSDDTK